VSGQLDGIEGKLEEQQKNTFQILEIVAELRYIDGIEDIEAVYLAVIKSMFLFILHNMLPFISSFQKRQNFKVPSKSDPYKSLC
jgi:hypothetical protein